MNDTRDDRLNRLFAAVRAAEVLPSPREEGFEERLMMRLRERQEQDALWYTWAWRFSPVFATVVIVLMIGSGISVRHTEREVSLAVTGNLENAHLISYLTGE